jgi:hypothetical protein
MARFVPCLLHGHPVGCRVLPEKVPDELALALTGHKIYKSGIASLEYAVEADRAKG